MYLILTGDWSHNDVPFGEDFPETLLENYGQYFDSNGDVIEGREENYEAFIYHVDRILPSVSADITKYHGDRRGQVDMSAVFKISDEAFALLMIENYFERWVQIAKEEEKSGKKKKNRDNEKTAEETRKRRREMKGKYTSSSAGYVYGGWDSEGIEHYNKLCIMVKELRKDTNRKETLDEKLKSYWTGVQEDSESACAKKRKTPQAPKVVPYVDED